MSSRYLPQAVMPAPLGDIVSDIPHWFVIGGQAVRCFCPYRPSPGRRLRCRHIRRLSDPARRARAAWPCRDQRAFGGYGAPHLERHQGFDLRFGDHRQATPRRIALSVEGILATKLHAIIDRGLRRDFFDLYVMLQQERRGIADCLSALREVYRQPWIKDTLVLRALTFFDDAERDVPLPQEGPGDWKLNLRDFFSSRVGHLLLVPPAKPLVIQARRVDVSVRRSDRRTTHGTRNGNDTSPFFTSCFGGFGNGCAR